ncbi:MAG: ATP-binding cassette domain-containing protein [Lachnospiraceae bacterium]|nr:ATP-binding cassette domain-containing protein [Lachnospiraceae bacterium]
MSKELDDSYINAIWEVTEAIQEETQVEKAVSACLDTLVRTTGVSLGLAWLINSSDKRLHIIACTGQTDLTGITTPVDGGVLGEVFNNRRAKQIDDITRESVELPGDIEDNGIEIKNTLIIPLCTKHVSYGCLQLINKTDGFIDNDLVLGGHLAALVSIDIEDKGYRIAYEKNKPLIQLSNVIKDYPSGDSTIRVLDGIDLTIYEQEFLVVLGESGCGKTTLLNIIGGMDRMTEGSMMVEDKDFSKPGERQLTRYRRDYVGFVFQSYNLMPNLSALENVRFIAENCKDSTSPEEAIEMVGLSDRKNNLPSQMSGGQQQRVSIARAIAKNPKLILADEPTAALDFKTSIEVLGIMEDIIRSKKKTVVMITHNAEISKMADRVVRIREGKISSIRINNSPLHAAELSW